MLVCYLSFCTDQNVWTPWHRPLNKLNAFYHQCISTVLGITNRQQCELHITLKSGVMVRQ